MEEHDRRADSIYLKEDKSGADLWNVLRMADCYVEKMKGGLIGGMSGWRKMKGGLLGGMSSWRKKKKGGKGGVSR